MKEQPPRFEIKPKVPYKNEKGRVEDKSAAETEARHIEEARNKRRGPFGIFKPKPETIAKAEREAGIMGKEENKKTNEKAYAENQETRKKWFEEFTILREQFNANFNRAADLNTKLLQEYVIRGNEDPTLEEYKEIQDYYAMTDDAVAALDKLILEGIEQIRPDYEALRKTFEEMRTNRIEASKLILQSDNFNDISKGIIKAKKFETDLYTFEHILGP